MNPENFVGPLIGAVVIIGGAIIGHAVHDAYKQGRMELDIERLKQDVGTHEDGLRGAVHKHANMLSRLRAVIYFIGRKLNLDVMKDLDDDK
jgi:hypothetical protein